MALRNRQEMAAALQQVMAHAYAELGERQRLEAESTLLKTYLLEAHANAADHDQALALLRDAFSQERLGERARARVRESEEDLFFNVEITHGRDTASFHVDATNGRYWIVHSTARSTPADRIIQRVVLQHPDLDLVWLPMQLLERITALGSFRGLGLDYDRRIIPDVDFEAADAPVEFLKMQLWGNRARDVLATLRGQGGFPDATTLSKVKVKHWLDRQADQEAFSLDDVKFDGKITARGTSFQSHISLVSSVTRDYSRRIADFERRFSLHFNFNDHGQGTMAGEPLAVVFGRPISNLEVFVSKVFSGAAPFRLSGVPIRVNERFYRVSAVDLHVGQPVTFEVAREFIRVFLPRGTCGNTVARLYTNFQHYYDSQVQLATADGEQVF